MVVVMAAAIVSGCGAFKRSASDEKHWWQWQTAKAPPLSLPEQYGLEGKGPAKRNRGEHLGLRFDHPRVNDFVSKFQTDLRGFYGRALERSGRYLPHIESILRKEGVPTELAYLPLIESGFRPHAVSPARAVGLWQFIPDTGRRYGLRIDSFVDERRDPVKSTKAAAQYLKDLYGMFNDWHLSLAAYNTGEARISRLLSTSDAGDFWELSDRGYLFRETRDYVPGFLAALQIASRPEAYGFSPPRKEPLSYDLVHIPDPMPLSAIARWSGTSLEEIKELNPALIRGVVPPGGYTVRVPDGTRARVEQAYASLSSAERASLRSAALPPPSRCTRRGKGRSCRSSAQSARRQGGTSQQPRASTPPQRGEKLIRVTARKQSAASVKPAPAKGKKSTSAERRRASRR